MKIKSVLAAALAGIILATSGVALARGPWAASKGNTAGWQIMTPEERAEHQTKMRSFTTYDECKAYQEEHHKLMMDRAKEKGLTLPVMAGGYGCDNMKKRGFLK